MGLSRSVKISILLTIDSVFFLVELIAGYAVGSLALVADSFHMLNDVMSLIVALYAIKLTQNSVASPRYSYGWHRAEILAALINGVFLLALCFSIFIEAIERFFSVPEVSNPQLVVIVGSFGLLSNIIGLFLFHDHGHSESHTHTPPSVTKAGSGISTPQEETAPLLPAQAVAPPITHQRTATTDSQTAVKPRLSSSSHRRSDSLSRPRRDSNTSIGFFPAQVRASLVQVAEEMRADVEAGGDSATDFVSTSPRKRSSGGVPAYMTQSAPALGEGGSLEEVLRRAAAAVDEESYSLAEEGRHAGTRNDVAAELHDSDDDADDHGQCNGHSHGHDDTAGGGHGGHSHGDMNMQAVLLHVMGDALGNIGVIASGLIIWLTSWQYKYYCDPAISLVITMIIFSSAMPLVRSASFILLQGVPTSVSLEAVHAAITRIPGVLSVHELHIWQLSETKIVASVHVLVKKSHKLKDKQHKEGSRSEDTTVLASGPPLDYYKGSGEETVYMSVASDIRRVLHDFGIHSSTIQPEYVMDGSEDEASSIRSGCLIPCMTDATCDPSNACCPPVAVAP
ncbi:hypothetical protein FRB94_009692 [Tulasnella sp. JGI-2019a]|nr:hypothetical protein FRB93_002566 [Tulasnella sp. JGI-2019a]KAG8994714.1 hypothetical protein FRB94_009692 [Tulasnella sp. JGI-2019a]KAG9032401.1 hypothetical protein FRB95_001522 [Tulasnella sp. JGI-2019a]